MEQLEFDFGYDQDKETKSEVNKMRNVCKSLRPDLTAKEIDKWLMKLLEHKLNKHAVATPI